jgi:catechol 2,3-dioxygenase-like lactoylglutathione lyase family enzyme
MTALLIATGVLLLAGVGLLAWRIARTSSGSGLHVTGVLHVNVNCSDFERSRRFYERLGFQKIMDVAPEGQGPVAAAVGMQHYLVRGALLAHRDGATLDLLEWRDPRDPSPPREGLNQLGIARIALTTTNLEHDVEALRAEGVRFLSEHPGEVSDPVGGTTRFICFQDPDGTVLELVELGMVMGTLQRASGLRRRA